jgi:hypothetical protein
MAKKDENWLIIICYPNMWVMSGYSSPKHCMANSYNITQTFKANILKLLWKKIIKKNSMHARF